MLRGGEANGAWAWYQFESSVHITHGVSTNSILFVLPLPRAGPSIAGRVPPSNPWTGLNGIQKPAEQGC